MNTHCDLCIVSGFQLCFPCEISFQMSVGLKDPFVFYATQKRSFFRVKYFVLPYFPDIHCSRDSLSWESNNIFCLSSVPNQKSARSCKSGNYAIPHNDFWTSITIAFMLIKQQDLIACQISDPLYHKVTMLFSLISHLSRCNHPSYFMRHVCGQGTIFKAYGQKGMLACISMWTSRPCKYNM